MIVETPKTIYELQIYNEIDAGEEYNRLVKKKDPTTKKYAMMPNMCEGEKSMLYDLVVSLPKYINFNWEDVIIENIVYNCYNAYMKNKNLITIQVIANCINACFPNKKAYVEKSNLVGTSPNLIIEDRRITNVQIQEDN